MEEFTEFSSLFPWLLYGQEPLIALLVYKVLFFKVILLYKMKKN